MVVNFLILHFLLAVGGLFWPETSLCNTWFLFVLQGGFWSESACRSCPDKSCVKVTDTRLSFTRKHDKFVLWWKTNKVFGVCSMFLRSPTWLPTIFQKKTCWMCVCTASITVCCRWRRSSEWVSWSSGERCFPSREVMKGSSPHRASANRRDDTSCS